MKRLAILALVLILTVGCGSHQEKSESHTVFAMDTVMTLTAYGQPSITAAALHASEDEIHRLDHLLSVTDSESDIAAINQSGTAAISRETALLIKRALEVSDLTEGAFDPTMGLISEAWGFRSGDTHVPDSELILSLLTSCGCDRVHLSGNQAEIGPDMALDLGGIAKGYTAEHVISALEESGVKSAVISLGGNVGTLGQKPGGELWHVAIENPDPTDEYAAVLLLEGGLFAVTSGAYERFFEENGIVYHHILDPNTGYPAATDLKSVTVISSDGTLADGLSTALFVMGFEGALEFWRQHSDTFQMILITDKGIFSTPELTLESSHDITILEPLP